MLRHMNRSTQDFKAQPVFNNWEVVAKGWYIACPSGHLRKCQVRSMDICGHRIALYRSADGQVSALDAFCAHMGTDLGAGTVVGDSLRCFFHHWRYDSEGRCVEVPCQPGKPASAKLQKWATQERYGFIWLWPDSTAPAPLLGHSELEGHEEVWLHGRPYERRCHHHVTMINGIDAQHLRTVHSLHFDMTVEVGEDPSKGEISFDLRGEVPSVTLRERLARRVLGPRYGYRMRYGHATVGWLTLMKHVQLFGTGPKLPELTMLFAYRPLAPGRTLVQPIYITRKRAGLTGAIISRFLLWLTKQAFFALRDEDGMVYENIRFHPGTLLTIDGPVARFIAHVNRYEPSLWSSAAQTSTTTAAPLDPMPV